MNHQVVTDYTNVNTENSAVRVYVRARPPDPSWTLEDDDASVEDKYQNPLQATLAGLSPKSNSAALSAAPHATSSAFISNFPENVKKICIKDPAAQGSSKHHGETYFSFDRVFWTECSQEELFQAVAKPQVENILDGFNGCCFAYGQTGSGKTYSMFGEGDGNSRGMIPRCMEEVFAQLERRGKDKEVAVVVSFLEIYCDRVRDLGEAYMSHRGRQVEDLKTTSDVYREMKSSRAESFQPRNKHDSWGNTHQGTSNGGVWESYLSMDLKIHEDVQGNVFVKDLSLIPVTTLEEVLGIIRLGLKLRATHETKMNQVSSRSHTVFTVTVVQRDPFTDEALTGMLNLVDLAGSERLKKSSSEGQRKAEALHINSSLTALGKVVMALDPSSGLTHVPYRDSKLTRLLQNSLGGNSFTVVLATVHPVSRFSEECLSTLQFANRCRSVHNHPRVNKLADGPASDHRKLKKLQDELQALRTRLGHGAGGMGGGARGVCDDDPNSRVLAVLAQMGLEGVTQLPDGSIRLPDGRIVGDFRLDGEGSAGDDGSGGSLAGGAGKRGRDACRRGMLKGVPAKVRMMVQGLEGEARGAKKKLQERKKELAHLHNQLLAGRAAFAERDKQSKQRESLLVEQLASVRAKLCATKASLTRDKDEQLAAVLAESQALLRRQRRTLLDAAKHRTRAQGQERSSGCTEQARGNEAEAAQHAQSLRLLTFSKEVEAQDLKQKCQQLVQAEARGQTLSETNLDRCNSRWKREVRELSVELLLVHDHAVLLYDRLLLAGLTPSPSSLSATGFDVPLPGCTATGQRVQRRSTTVIGDTNVNPDSMPTQRSTSQKTLTMNLLLQSASLPRLSKLVRERGEQFSDRCLTRSKPAAGCPRRKCIYDSSGNGHEPRLHQPRVRPQSAGIERPFDPQNTSASANIFATEVAGGPPFSDRPRATERLEGTCVRHERHESWGGCRPRSAPGQRTRQRNVSGRNSPGESVEGEGLEGRGGGQGGRGARALLGWSTRDFVFRSVDELSRDGLLRLIRVLRERRRVVPDEVDRRGEHERTQVCGLDQQVRDVHESAATGSWGENSTPAEGRADLQSLLLEQARRYNDLRVAYTSTSRRLQKLQIRGVRGRGKVNGSDCGGGNIPESRKSRQSAASRVASANLHETHSYSGAGTVAHG